MNKVQFEKKLVLKKLTLANLVSAEMGALVGGMSHCPCDPTYKYNETEIEECTGAGGSCAPNTYLCFP